MKVKTKVSLVTVFSIVAVISLAAGIAYHLNNQKSVASKVDPPVKLSRADIIKLNNDGVRALNEQDFKTAIACFSRALKADPNYGLAKKNLAISYNNYGLTLSEKPMLALKQFHCALSCDPDNIVTRSNVEGIIRYMKLEPNSFYDRVNLAEAFASRDDTNSALWEYKAALDIREDPDVRTQYEKLLARVKKQ